MECRRCRKDRPREPEHPSGSGTGARTKTNIVDDKTIDRRRGPFAPVLATMIYFPFFRSSDSKSVAVTRSIAVLPLRPIDPANRSDIFEIGIANARPIQRLTAIKGFVVLPLSASRKYTEIEQSPLVAGRELNVDYVVTSNYEIANGRIKVTSQFVNSATGKVEDTVTVEKDSANFFSAQDAIANDFGNRLLADSVPMLPSFKQNAELTLKKLTDVICWR